MTYTTRTALEETFGADDIADLEYGRPNALDQAIAKADALIDSYVGNRYSLPLAEIPPVLAEMALDLVRYNLDKSPDEIIKDRNDKAIKYLERVSAGKASLGIPQASEPVSLDTAEIQSGGNVFHRDNSKGFI